MFYHCFMPIGVPTVNKSVGFFTDGSIRWHDDMVNVLRLGADNTGALSSTQAFQTAIDTAYPGGTVYCPAGIYRIGPLILKQGVNFTGPPRGMKQGNQIFPGILPTDGAMLMMESAGKLFDMKQQSSVQNLCVYYPLQKTSGTPDEYDYTFYMGANEHGCSLINITAINPYRLAYVNIGGVLIQNVIAGPLNRGITLARVADVARICNVHFNVNINQNNQSSLVDYVKANLAAFVVDGAEEFNFTDCFCVICLQGLLFTDEDGDNFRGAYGSWKGGGIDVAAACIQVLGNHGLTNRGLRLSDCSLVPRDTDGVGIKFQHSMVSNTFDNVPAIWGSNITMHGPHLRSIWMDSASDGVVVVNGGSFQGMTGQAALVEKAVNGLAGGRLHLDHIAMPAGTVRTAGAGAISDTNQVII